MSDARPSRLFGAFYFVAIGAAMLMSLIFTMSVVGAAAGGGSFVLGVVYGWTARATKGSQR